MVHQEQEKIFENLDGVSLRARPFKTISRPHNDNLAILVHGFTGSPYSMRHLAEWLTNHGFDTEAILLPGHGRQPKSLKKTTPQDWYRSLDEAIRRQQDNYKNIWLVGHSFGVNLSLHASLRYPEKIKGIVSLNISVFLRKEKLIRFFLPVARLVKEMYKKHWHSKVDEKIYGKTGSYNQIPLKNISQFYGFIDQYTKQEVKNFNLPILIIHSRDDELSLPRSSEWLFKNIASQDKQIFVINKECHHLLFKTRRDFVFAKISDWLTKHKPID
jgi:carboxylesterase